MPMGIVNDDEFEREIKDSHINVPKSDTNVTVEDIKKGRGEGNTEVPEEIREIVAKCAINGEGSGAAIAAAFNVSPSSVSAYKVGAHSTTTYDNPNESLLDKLNEHKAHISKKARSRLLSALNGITPEKLKDVKPRDLAAIAKDMSSIVSDMEPQVNSNQQTNNVQFVFMAPRVRDINDYKIIDVND